MSQTKRLSLDQFKTKNTNFESQQELEKISGGVMGACHSGVETETVTECGLWGAICVTMETYVAYYCID